MQPQTTNPGLRAAYAQVSGMTQFPWTQGFWNLILGVCMPVFKCCFFICSDSIGKYNYMWEWVKTTKWDGIRGMPVWKFFCTDAEIQNRKG